MVRRGEFAATSSTRTTQIRLNGKCPFKRVTSVVRGRARRSFTGKEGMIWEAEATEPVAKGEKVKVVAVLDTLKVRVRKA